MTSGKIHPKRIDGYQVKIPYSTTIALCKHPETKRVTYTGTCEIDVICKCCGALLESADRS